MIIKFFRNMFSKQKRIETKIKDVLFKTNKNCHYCGIKLYREECTLDHIIPVSKNGDTSLGNSVICCNQCNQLKGASDYIDFKEIINTVEKRDFYWKKFSKKINDNIVIDIVYPYLSAKINEYKDRITVIEKNKQQLLKIYNKDHKKIKDLTTKQKNIERELFNLRKKMRYYKKKIPNYT